MLRPGAVSGSIGSTGSIGSPPRVTSLGWTGAGSSGRAGVDTMRRCGGDGPHDGDAGVSDGPHAAMPLT
eukprot:6484247-Prymnesium_polylepis.1